MMKVFSSTQIKKWDLFSIANLGISSADLMERAAKSCADWLADHYTAPQVFTIFCGNGNNGGDGFAIARLLYQQGYDVQVFTDSNKSFSKDASINFHCTAEISGIEILDFQQAISFPFKENTIIIDALFGIGLNRKIEGEMAEIIKFLNTLNFSKISIDLPSGLRADTISEDNSIIFKADKTLTFQSWKKSMLHPETGKYAGKVHVLDIGLSKEFISEEESEEYIIDENLALEIYQPRSEFSNKGTYGKTTIIAGSFGKIGAAVMATKACLRSGSGITFVVAPKCGYEILQSVCPEAMFISGGESHITHFKVGADSVPGIGPGLGTAAETERALLQFVKDYKKALVLDADALNILSKNPDDLKLIPKDSIITPHPKEFERLFGKTENSFVRTDLALKKAKELGIFIVLKDHHTQVITPLNQIYYNITGNSGMAKGGSGDALLGMITALLAQGYSSEHAAVFGVWLHGKAGDFAADKFSKEAMLPSELIEEIGNVFQFLAKKNPSG